MRPAAGERSPNGLSPWRPLRTPTFLNLWAKRRASQLEEDVWVPTLDESHLQEETITLVSPKGVSIILIKKDGHIYALRNRCAHMSCTLAGGRLDGYTLQCPCHGGSTTSPRVSSLMPERLPSRLTRASPDEERYSSSWRNDETGLYVHSQYLPLVPKGQEIFQ
jgi:hypothetical protein